MKQIRNVFRANPLRFFAILWANPMWSFAILKANPLLFYCNPLSKSFVVPLESFEQILCSSFAILWANHMWSFAILCLQLFDRYLKSPQANEPDAGIDTRYPFVCVKDLSELMENPNLLKIFFFSQNSSRSLSVPHKGCQSCWRKKREVMRSRN